MKVVCKGCNWESYNANCLSNLRVVVKKQGGGMKHDPDEGQWKIHCPECDTTGYIGKEFDLR